MIDSILFRIRWSDVQALEAAVHGWTARERNGVSAFEIEDAVRVSLRLPKDLKDVWDSAWQRASSEPAGHQQDGERVRDFFASALKTTLLLRDLVRRCEHDGQAIAGSQQLEQVVEEIRHMRDQFMDSWLWITETIRRESDEEYARGDFQTVQEILDELQGKHS